MKENYRATFCGNDKSKQIDLYAVNFDDAFEKAYQQPEARNRIYTDVIIEKIPTEPGVIGIEFEYTDIFIKKNYRGYLFIKAKNEAEAVQYYNVNFKGKRFWFDAGKTEEDGKCIRGKVIQTYFAPGPGYHADATL